MKTLLDRIARQQDLNFSPMSGTPEREVQEFQENFNIPIPAPQIESVATIGTPASNQLPGEQFTPDTVDEPTDRPTQEVDRYSQLLVELDKLRQASQQETDAARANDRTLAVLGGIGQGLNTALAGNLASRRGVNVTPANVDIAGSLEAFKQQPQMQQDFSNRMAEIQRKLDVVKGQDTIEQRKLQRDMMQQERELRRKDQEDAREGFKTERLERTGLAGINNLASQYEKDDVIKAFKKQDIAFSEVDNVLEQMEKGNTLALGAIGTKLARAMGEVGVLTDKDVVRYINRMDLKGSLEDRLARYLRGELSPATLEDARGLSQAMKKATSQKIEPVREKYLQRAYETYGKKMGLAKEDVEVMMGLDRKIAKPQETTPQTDTVNVVDPTGRVRIIPRDKLDAALKAGGKLAE